MRKKAFTLIELLIVVVIISILALIGAPHYFKSLEKAKSRDARIGLSQLYRAELEYGADRMGYYTDSIDDLRYGDVVLNERYWDFTVATPTSTTFTVIATRSGGSYSGQTITMDHLGNVSGNWEFLD